MTPPRVELEGDVAALVPYLSAGWELDYVVLWDRREARYRLFSLAQTSCEEVPNPLFPFTAHAWRAQVTAREAGEAEAAMLSDMLDPDRVEHPPRRKGGGCGGTLSYRVEVD